jgi:hypothetical protein
MSQTTNPFFLANRDAINRYADFTSATTRRQYLLLSLVAIDNLILLVSPSKV